ncbi:MAG: O-antigen ligase family protein, partial [Nitrososphaerales archaeon]
FEEFSIFEKDSSFSNRNLIWIYILAKVAASPWIGYGLDQLAALTNKNNAEFFNNVGFLVNSAHNGFLETAFSLGFLGLVLTLWVLVSQLTNKSVGAGFGLLFGYVVSFILINTFESKLISFNFYLIGLMYVIAVAGAMATLGARSSSVYTATSRHGSQGRKSIAP